MKKNSEKELIGVVTKCHRFDFKAAVRPQEELLLPVCLQNQVHPHSLTLLIHMCNPCNKFALAPLGVVQTHTENVENNQAVASSRLALKC